LDFQNAQIMERMVLFSFDTGKSRGLPVRLAMAHIQFRLFISPALSRVKSLVVVDKREKKRRYGTTQGIKHSLIKKALKSRCLSRLMMKPMTMRSGSSKFFNVCGSGTLRSPIHLHSGARYGPASRVSVPRSQRQNAPANSPSGETNSG